MRRKRRSLCNLASQSAWVIVQDQRTGWWGRLLSCSELLGTEEHLPHGTGAERSQETHITPRLF